MKARLRPQRKQRRTIRVENFGFFKARALVEVLATMTLISLIKTLMHADKKDRRRLSSAPIRIPIGVYPRSGEILAKWG
jgi:hypothetical protein